MKFTEKEINVLDVVDSNDPLPHDLLKGEEVEIAMMLLEKGFLDATHTIVRKHSKRAFTMTEKGKKILNIYFS